MKQVIIKHGQVVVENVPAPLVERDRILVQVDHSCISIGTEMSGVKSSGMPLWKRAMQQPENVKKVLQMVKDQGIARTRSLVEGKLEAGNATGYSAAGIVLEVGEDIQDIRPGDRVACAGAQCAHHAEIICVPRNLTVPVPDHLPLSKASTVTLGAIAMQGIRRANPTIGETFVVLGLGILGQLASQMLRANGCNVIGVDLDNDRVKLAESLRMNMGLYNEQGPDIEQVFRLTGGVGADGVIITAATSSDEVISKAFKMCRKKGRVVLVGDVGLNLNRADFYQKELDLFISTSYGPGRYDNNYEEKGLDYPVAYVRWTENRNMEAYLRLVADGEINIDPLIHKTYPIDEATQAYSELKNSDKKPLMVLLSYADRNDAKAIRMVRNHLAIPSKKDQIKVAVVGAGGFAKGMHLPNLQKLSAQYHIQAVVSRTGHNATATSKQFGASYATTDYNHVLQDPDVDLVIITTRHDQHAEMTLQGLQAGKHVLVEKPLAMTKEQLHEINAWVESAEKPPILLTGYNRRFSPYVTKISEIVQKRTNPMIINYRMNAGYIPLDHWVHGPEGGGRNIGEACHIYDLFTFLTNSRVAGIHAQSISPATSYYSHRDNFTTVITFEDGSVASLTYTALGDKNWPKEQMEIFTDGKVISLNDYRQLTVSGIPNFKAMQSSAINKGQLEELKVLASVMKDGGEWPIPLWQQTQTMEITFEVEEQLMRKHNKE